MNRTKFYIALTCAVTLPVISLAWTGPTATPPNGNVSAPVNVAISDQFKPGILGANILNVYGSNQYINFGTTTGSTGFGFRNTEGKIEAKNSGGTWSSLTDKPWFVTGGNGAVGWQAQTAASWLTPTTLTQKVGNAAASYNSATGRFTAPEAGLYYCYFSAYKSYDVAGGYHHVISSCSSGYCNGMANHDYDLNSNGTGGYDVSTSKGAGIFNLALNETIHFQMYSSVSNTYSYYPPYTRFGCAML
ncbi:MAG: hypothetical protein WAX38_01640 [Minisyncoccia bacterium]